MNYLDSLLLSFLNVIPYLAINEALQKWEPCIYRGVLAEVKQHNLLMTRLSGVKETQMGIGGGAD